MAAAVTVLVAVVILVVVVVTTSAAALPSRLARSVAAPALVAAATSLAPAAVSAVGAATATTSEAASAVSSIAIALAITTTTAVVVVTTASSALVSPVFSVAILVELWQLSALADIEVDAVRRLAQSIEVLEETLVQVGADVEDDARPTTQCLHVLDHLSRARVEVLLKNRVGIAMIEAAALRRGRHDDCLHALSAIEQTLSLQLLLVVTGRVREHNLKSLLGVALVLLDEILGEVSEQIQHVLINVLQVLHDATLRGLDDVFGLRNADSLELDASLRLNALHELVRLLRVEGDADAGLASSGSTTGAMDVRLSVLGWLNLDDQVDVGDVEAARSHVRGHQHLELALLEALDGDLTLTLDDVTVHDLHLLLDLLGEDQLVSVLLGLSKHDSLRVATVAGERVSQGRQSVLVGALDGEMLHGTRRFVLQVLRQVNNLEALLHVLFGDGTHPARDRGREQTQLDVVLARGADVVKDGVDVLLEAELEHLVCFVEYDRLEVVEVNVATLDVVEDAARRANEDVDTVAKLSRLVIDADATINSEYFELVFVVFDFFELSAHLQGQLSRGREDDSLDASLAQVLVLPEVLDDGQTEGERLARASQVARNNIVALVNWIEAVLLDGEQVDDLFLLERRDRLLRDLGEGRELAVGGRGNELLGLGVLSRNRLQLSDIVVFFSFIGLRAFTSNCILVNENGQSKKNLRNRNRIWE